MSDLLAGRTVYDFQALVACGGFSYGDVLGRGRRLGEVDLVASARPTSVGDSLSHRPQTLALGVCNGCQMMSNLRQLIPGSEALAWCFVRATSSLLSKRASAWWK
ncbi:phosphoribosylformylglycinamidine synthase subunit PurQ [Shigella flexneri]